MEPSDGHWLHRIKHQPSALHTQDRLTSELGTNAGKCSSARAVVRSCVWRAVGTSEVGTSEVGTSEVGASEVGASEVGTSEVGTSERS